MNDMKQPRFGQIVEILSAINKAVATVLERERTDLVELIKALQKNGERLTDLMSVVFKAVFEKKDLIVFNPDVQIWQIITLGNYKSLQELFSALENNSIEVVNWIKMRLDGLHFSFADKEKRYQVATATLLDLGLDEKAVEYNRVVDRILELGGKICPQETAMQLLLQAKNIGGDRIMLPIINPIAGEHLLYINENYLRMTSLESGKISQAVASKLKVIYLL